MERKEASQGEYTVGIVSFACLAYGKPPSIKSGLTVGRAKALLARCLRGDEDGALGFVVDGRGKEVARMERRDGTVHELQTFRVEPKGGEA